MITRGKILASLLGAATAIVTAGSALAAPAWDFEAAGNSFNNNNWTFATKFTVLNDVEASGLGYYADPNNGQVDSNPVSLYKCDSVGCFTTGTLLASVVVTNAYAIQGHFRFVTIDPILLTAGDYLVSGVSHGDNYTWNDVGFFTDPNISVPLFETRWELESGGGAKFLNYINTNEIESDGFWGPNVFLGKPTFTDPVPEPATWAMMLAGFATVGFAMRRRRSVAVNFA